jgi:dihydroorotate dehydrogenase (fumarate)
MYSLFEEQIIHESLELDHYLTQGSYSSSEAVSYLPEAGRYILAPEAYVNNLQKLKQAVKIPVIGSLNGVSTGGWIKYAKKIQDAGADALELNIYYLPTDAGLTGAEIEKAYSTLVSDVCKSIKIPVAVKLSPFFSSIPNMAKQMVEAGAKGLVLFNRFYQPDLDIEDMKVIPNLKLSTSSELRLPLRWIAILYGRIQADFALTTGIHSIEDVVKGIMAGANVTMMASELLQQGVGRAAEIEAGLESWMAEHEYISIQQMCGSMSQKAVAEPAAFERANYMKVLSSFSFIG